VPGPIGHEQRSDYDIQQAESRAQSHCDRAAGGGRRQFNRDPPNCAAVLIAVTALPQGLAQRTSEGTIMTSQATNNPAVIYAAGAVSRNSATDELIATYPYQTATAC
jgi:hypothetical protein